MRELMIQEPIIADLRKHGFELAEPGRTVSYIVANDPTRISWQIMGAVAMQEIPIAPKLRGARMRKSAKEDVRRSEALRLLQGERAALERVKAHSV